MDFLEKDLEGLYIRSLRHDVEISASIKEFKLRKQQGKNGANG